jgi:hypothetical protein
VRSRAQKPREADPHQRKGVWAGRKTETRATSPTPREDLPDLTIREKGPDEEHPETVETVWGERLEPRGRYS